LCALIYELKEFICVWGPYREVERCGGVLGICGVC
jgi:hypothetical protein